MTAPTTGPFEAKITPDLRPGAQALVAAYDATPGSSGPYCCPAALAAALELALGEYPTHGTAVDLYEIIGGRIQELRGEMPWRTR